jgi:hypothetical protein
MVGLGNNKLLLTMGWMVDVTLSCILLWSSALSGKMPSTTTVEAEVAPSIGGIGRCSIVWWW